MTRRLDLVELYVDKATAERVMMLAYARAPLGADIRATMAEIVGEMVAKAESYEWQGPVEESATR